MKNSKFLFLGISIIAFASCGIRKQNIEAKIKYTYFDSCDLNCQRIDVYAKNKTSHRYYFKGIEHILNSRRFTNKHRETLLRRSHSYHKLASKHRSRDTVCTCKYSSVYSGKYSEKNWPACFKTVAIRKELEVFNEHNELYPYDSILIDDVKSWVNIKYSGVHFLEPYEECLIYSSFIDYKIPETNKLKYFITIKNFRGKNRRYLRTKRRGDNTPIESYQGFFDEVAGYKLFKGRSRSNKLIIENGELIKDRK